MNKRIIITIIALAIVILGLLIMPELSQHGFILASFLGSFTGVMIIPIFIFLFLYMSKLRNRLQTKAVVIIFIILSLYGIILGINAAIETQSSFINATAQQAAEELQQELQLPHKWGESAEITDIYAEGDSLVLKLLYKDDAEPSRGNIASSWLCTEIAWRELLEEGVSIRFDYSTTTTQQTNSILVENEHCTP